MERKNFYKEHEDDEVNGFVVIETDLDEEVRVAEKWNRSKDQSEWLSYWIPAEKLADRCDEDLCSFEGKVSDKQFKAVCGKVDERAMVEA